MLPFGVSGQLTLSFQVTQLLENVVNLIFKVMLGCFAKFQAVLNKLFNQHIRVSQIVKKTAKLHNRAHSRPVRPILEYADR